MKFTQATAKSSFKVLLWSVASATIGAVVVWLGELPLEGQYLYIVSAVNTLLYGIKEAIDNRA